MTFQVTTKHSIFLPGEHLIYLHFFPAQRRQISIPGMSENQVRWSGCDRNNLLEYKDGNDQDKGLVIVRERFHSRKSAFFWHFFLALFIVLLLQIVLFKSAQKSSMKRAVPRRVLKRVLKKAL